MFRWKILDPGFHVDVTWTFTTHLNTAADHVHPLLATQSLTLFIQRSPNTAPTKTLHYPSIVFFYTEPNIGGIMLPQCVIFRKHAGVMCNITVGALCRFKLGCFIHSSGACPPACAPTLWCCNQGCGRLRPQHPRHHRPGGHRSWHLQTLTGMKSKNWTFIASFRDGGYWKVNYHET